MKTLLIATSNPSKILMYQSLFLLNGLDDEIDVKFLSDYPSIPKVEENGESVKENALIKARYYAQQFGVATLADDTGFCINGLDGKPGVKARRWDGQLSENTSDEDWLAYYVEQIKDLDSEKESKWGPLVSGSLPFCQCLYMINGMSFFNEGATASFFAKTPRKPYKDGSPLSSVRVFADGRHELDISDTDACWEQESLVKLLQKFL